jgi:NAD(P)-dependent dehydrogenase (short-subunit alcohol dehydrogenase family)
MENDLENLFSLNDKVVVITGAAGLLGRRHAESVAAFGGHPVLLDLSQGLVTSIADQINEKYDVRSSGFAVDITDEAEIKLNAREIIENYGKIDCLVNNAANNPKMEKTPEKNFSRLENFPHDLWNKDIAVGLTGAFLCAKHYGYQIAQNPSGGSIVNISSDLGLIAPDQRLYAKTGLPENLQPVKPITYSVVKTGLIGLTRYLATYWTDKNVRCNALCPGGVENGQSDEFLREVSLRIPMNRLAKADEYQGTLVWMLSDASSYLNGAILPIDGGRTAW